MALKVGARYSYCDWWFTGSGCTLLYRRVDLHSDSILLTDDGWWRCVLFTNGRDREAMVSFGVSELICTDVYDSRYVFSYK